MSLSLAFEKIDEPYAAGFFAYPERSLFFRFAHAQRRFWESMPLPAYNGELLYPHGPKYVGNHGVVPDYSFTFNINKNRLLEKGCGEAELAALSAEEKKLFPNGAPIHSVGGFLYTHSIPNYPRILSQGLNSYEHRIQKLREGDFRDGLLEITAGLRTYHSRCIEHLKQSGADSALIATLENVPFLPAKNLYEAVIAWNFIFYVDGCDNPGRLDAGLFPYHRGENIEELLRAFFINTDQNNSWSSALGPECNPLTLQCLKAVRGLRRPSLEMRVDADTPTEIWQAACDALVSGCGQPAFYNEELYQRELERRFPNIPKTDLLRFNGGGCTETMLEGISNVGSLDAGINLALIFSEYMNSSLSLFSDFEAFYTGLIDKIQTEVSQTLDIVNEHRKRRSKIRPQPTRTLLIDDCIDKGLDFNAGGARHYWSVINFAGLVNVIDSLLAIKFLIFDNNAYTTVGFLDALNRREPHFLQMLRSCPCYGVDDAEADKLATRFSTDVFTSMERHTPYLGGAFLPSSIQFVTYGDAGRGVGATPDGRSAGEPLADSIGAIHGKDVKGPTAMLNSAAKLSQYLALGTPILNISLTEKWILRGLPALIQGYFSQGGMQVQVNCLSRADMLDALEHPERHENLIVRIGGYSEYFNRLSLEMKKTVIDRTEFGVQL